MFKVFISIIFIISSLFAVDEKYILGAMEDKTVKMLELLQNKSVTKDEKAKVLINIMDDIFDFHQMAKISLGKRYATLNEDQKEKFTDVFIVKIKESYIDKIDLYTDEKIVVKEQSRVKEDRIQVLSQIIGKDQAYDIVYKFYNKNGDWLIYDVDILGVSIIQTYRSQFNEFLQSKTIEQLIENLKNNS